MVGQGLDSSHRRLSPAMPDVPLFEALFIGAHPDDVEILAGGTVAKLARAGHRVVVADATRGEMGSRGTVEERAAESADAARILGVERRQLGLPDGRVGDDMPATIRAMVELIRATRPRLIFTHEPGDHHPDHNAVAEAVKFAWFQANVVRYETGQPRWRAARLIHFVGVRERWAAPPSFLVDISETFDTKVESLRAHRSQLHNPAYDGPATYVSSPEAWRAIEVRAAFFGTLIGTRYAEAFRTEAPMRVDDPVAFFGGAPAPQ